MDGSSPFVSPQGVATGRLYTGPIPITTTTCLRAIATKAGWMSTKVDTHTYFFLDDVIRQATDPQTRAQVTPAGLPDLVGLASRATTRWTRTSSAKTATTSSTVSTPRRSTTT